MNSYDEHVMRYFESGDAPDSVFAHGALARLRQDWLAILDRWRTVALAHDMPAAIAAIRRAEGDLNREACRLLAGGLATRPPRRMPSLTSIADHRGLLGKHPHCVRCGWQPPVTSWAKASQWLERAHIIDRVVDGLDLTSNLAPLCSPCHRSQPIFWPADEGDALSWFGLTNSDAT